MIASKTKKGFTLIEILIVVAIIGILSSVALIGLVPVQKKGRDTRRLADIRSIQAGLELYFASNGTYPDASGWADTLIASPAAGIKSMPVDPTTKKYFYYATNSDRTTYILGAKLEDSNPALDSDVDTIDTSVYTSRGATTGNYMELSSCADASSSFMYCISL